MGAQRGETGATGEPIRTGRTAGWLAWRVVEWGTLVAGVLAMALFSLYGYHIHSTDLTEYHHYALAFWTSPNRFHALPAEYPPLAILIFSLILLPPLANFQAVFMFWMGVLALVGYAAIVRFAGRRRALAYAVYLALGTAGVLLTHFDLVPALVTLAALWAAARGRFSLAYVLLAAGILLKLYPLFLVPVVALEHWRATSAKGAYPTGTGRPRASLASPGLWAALRGMALCGALTAAGFAIAFALAGAGVFSPLLYQMSRPLQLESLPATLLWLGTFLGFPAHADYIFASYNYVGPLDGGLKLLSSLALVVGCCWIYWRQASGRLGLGRAWLACLCVVVLTNKIFSPQYLIWVLPVVAVVEGLDLLWIAVCLLTALDFPVLYRLHPFGIAPYGWPFMLVVAVRNLLLLVVTARAILTSGRSPTMSQPVSRVAEPVLAAGG